MNLLRPLGRASELAGAHDPLYELSAILFRSAGLYCTKADAYHAGYHLYIKVAPAISSEGPNLRIWIKSLNSLECRGEIRSLEVLSAALGLLPPICQHPQCHLQGSADAVQPIPGTSTGIRRIERLYSPQVIAESPLLDRRGGAKRRGGCSRNTSLEQPPRLRLRRIHPSCPGGVIGTSAIVFPRMLQADEDRCRNCYGSHVRSSVCLRSGGRAARSRSMYAWWLWRSGFRKSASVRIFTSV